PSVNGRRRRWSPASAPRSSTPVRGKRAVVRIAVAVLTVVMGWAVGQSQPATLATANAPVPREYWGMHIHRAGSLGQWPAVFGSWRLWDAHVAWSGLEPRSGAWRFGALGADVEQAGQRGGGVPPPPGGVPPLGAARQPNTPAVAGRSPRGPTRPRI